MRIVDSCIINICLYFGQERSMVKLQSRTKAVTGWRGPTDPRSVALLEGTGLYQLQHCVLPQHNNPLIEAFIERWQPDTNTFHMPFGEMTITLHDVHYIMGLRVSGHRPYTDMQKSLVIESGSRIFDLDILKIESWWHNGGPRLEDLQELYGDHSSASSECKVRAYIIYLLGSTLFVNKSGARVKPDFCPLIEDIEQIREYSWGSGTLANLYRQLGMASRAEAKQISGCLTLLECWIYEYFPSFRPPTVKAHVIGEPWCMRWHISDVVRKDSSRLLEYRRMLDHLRATDVSNLYNVLFHLSELTVLLICIFYYNRFIGLRLVRMWHVMSRRHSIMVLSGSWIRSSLTCPIESCANSAFDRLFPRPLFYRCVVLRGKEKLFRIKYVTSPMIMHGVSQMTSTR
ncbi:PREDICTED: serine/threonine-protein phosphatase 7 long form homolog [Erythranthe guttata]|uniref:serine/threonine-protein phosphatase 7 long form homolog n=1 Tax=Erythranthe guttata TaxID=4155 RepID=UPI00064DAEED|nr:PREDICTED: serine/threonine-protein phosphatase 7 long form homolog [Erythranthe guttata]|eukprot:XP_012858101.1 PREDICTED: serine/threonine-protein phosphatase 7 long form homolog [Erythranthe guttata]